MSRHHAGGHRQVSVFERALERAAPGSTVPIGTLLAHTATCQGHRCPSCGAERTCPDGIGCRGLGARYAECWPCWFQRSTPEGV